MSRRRLAALALAATVALPAVALSACETTAEKSAKLEHQAKRVTLTDKGLSIARESRTVKVIGTAVVHGSERAAAIVTLQNRSAHALRGVPIAITVKDAHGATLFQNNAPGLEGALVSVPSIAAHATVVWVDDQLPANGAPTSVSAKVGETPSVRGSPAALAITGARISEDPANGVVATGTVTNRSKVAQSSLVLVAVARRGSAIVGAGRAVVAELAPGASSPFQASLVGQALGARLAVSAPPASFGQ
jgi:hypothetical protein